MTDPTFDRQTTSPDSADRDPDTILLRVVEYLSNEDANTPDGIEVARCVRTKSVDSSSGDGTESLFVLVTSHIEEDKTLVAVRVYPDTGYSSVGGSAYAWRQMAGGGGSLPTGTIGQVLTVIDETGAFVPGEVVFT